MAEYFDNFLSLHHFLDITISRTKVFLLLYEVFSTQSCNTFRKINHNADHSQTDNSKRNT